jgi:hypothetical protein
MICTAIGDSIAVGYGQVAQCTINARVGASSGEIARKARGAGFCVISAGSNDPDNPRLVDNLLAIRRKVSNCSSVVWIVPVNQRAAHAVRQVAAKFGDRAVPFKPSKDNVHPKSYVALYKAVTP